MGRTGSIRAWAALAAAVAIASGAAGVLRSDATPRYAARYGQRCGLCHVNPTGGGIRSEYAAQQLVPEEMAWAKGDSVFLPSPEIAPHVTLGADLRELWVGSSSRVHRLEFFPMQGDLDVALQLDAKTALVYRRGLSNTYELFGTSYLLPWTGYVKAGRFVPSYGWRFDDHTMYVRSGLGLEPPGDTDGGVEAGIQPGRFDVQLGIMNGARGALFDNDGGVAVIANGIVRFRVGPVNAGAGAQGWTQSQIADVFQMGGVHGYLSWGPLTWVGEGDLTRTWGRGTAPGAPGALVASHELSAVLHQGLEAIATYDFADPDRHLKSGAKSRYGIGVQLMPRPYATLGASVRTTRVDSGPDVADDEYTEVLLQLHLLY